jgi:hypothetical protein
MPTSSIRTSPASPEEESGGSQTEQQRDQYHHGQRTSGGQRRPTCNINVDKRTDHESLIPSYRTAKRYNDDIGSEMARIDGLYFPGELPTLARLK